MSAPPFEIAFTSEALRVLEDLGKPKHADKLARIQEALSLLRDFGPSYPSLRTHQMQSIKGVNGKPVFQSYVENNTPSAWRIWWQYSDQPEQISIVSIGPHP